MKKIENQYFVMIVINGLHRIELIWPIKSELAYEAHVYNGPLIGIQYGLNCAKTLSKSTTQKMTQVNNFVLIRDLSTSNNLNFDKYTLNWHNSRSASC